MKNFILGMGIACFSAGATAEVNAPAVQDAALKGIETLKSHLSKNVINWQVGEWHTTKIQFLFPGKGKKEIVSEDASTGQDAIWYRTTTQMMGQSQVAEQLIARADGRVLRTIVNGEEQPATQEDPAVEILEQAETTITVPAGTFECMYTKANVTQDGKVQQMEIWQNPIDVNMDGTLKVVVYTELGAMTQTLKDFGPRN